MSMQQDLLDSIRFSSLERALVFIQRNAAAFIAVMGLEVGESFLIEYVTDNWNRDRDDVVVNLIKGFVKGTQIGVFLSLLK